MTAQNHSKLLHQLIRVSPSTNTAILLGYLGHLSLQQRWLQACIRFRNALVALHVDDLFRDALYDSLHEAGTPGPRNAGFAKGVHDRCALLGWVADSSRGCFQSAWRRDGDGALSAIFNCNRRRSMCLHAYAHDNMNRAHGGATPKLHNQYQYRPTQLPRGSSFDDGSHHSESSHRCCCCIS